MKRLSVVILSILALLSSLHSAAAQSQGLTLAPVIIERSVESGRTYNLMVKVQGTYNETKGVSVELSSFTYKDNSGEPAYIEQDTEESRELASWFSYEPLFTLEPRNTVNYPLTVTIPENTQPGGYYATLFFEPQGVTQPVASGVATKVRMGAHILLTVDENSTFKKLTLEDFQLAPTQANEETIFFEADIKNEGNVHLVPAGRIEVFDSKGAKVNNLATVKVKNASGQIIAEVPSDFLPVNEESMKALPGQLRTISIPWNVMLGQTLDDTYKVTYLMAEDGKTDFQEKTLEVELRKKIAFGNLHVRNREPLVYAATLKNPGTIAITPELSLSIKDFFTRDAWIDLNRASTETPLLPGESREVLFSDNAGLKLPVIRVVQIQIKDSIGNILYTTERIEMEWYIYLLLCIVAILIIAPIARYGYNTYRRKRELV